jgi:RimJ/RimL family protein N-acetyltransferase
MIETITDKKILESFLRKDAGLYLYHIGDLDDFFFPYTQWKGIRENGELKSIYMLYDFPGLPTLLALSPAAEAGYLERLMEISMDTFPERFYSHLTPGIEQVLEKGYYLEGHGTHLKMALEDEELPERVDTEGVIRFSVEDAGRLKGFYEESYPGNWFDPRMLETGMYFGTIEDGKITCTAGVHVYSEDYGIAALGNITTHPAHRGKGLGTKSTAKLCKELLKKVNFIGLNVKDNNIHAISCYKKLGFKVRDEYNEYFIKRKI